MNERFEHKARPWYAGREETIERARAVLGSGNYSSDTQVSKSSPRTHTYGEEPCRKELDKLLIEICDEKDTRIRNERVDIYLGLLCSKVEYRYPTEFIGLLRKLYDLVDPKNITAREKWNNLIRVRLKAAQVQETIHCGK